MREGRNNTILLTVIGIATLLVAVAGATFAYFTAQTKYTDTNSTLIITAGSGGSILLEGGEVKVENIYPETDKVWATKVIRFTNQVNSGTTMGSARKYQLNLKYTSEFSAGALAYTFTPVLSTDSTGICLADGSTSECAAGMIKSSDTNSSNLINVSTQTKITGTGTGTQTIGTGTFAVGTENATHVYVLKIYFPDTGVNQNADQGKTFTGHVEATSVEG